MPTSSWITLSCFPAQHAAYARYFLPRDFRMTGFHFVREVATRLGNNLDAALDEPLPLPIGLKDIEGHIPKDDMNAFDSLDDVR